MNTTIDATWLDDTPAAVVDVPVDSPAYRLINELTAERDTLEKILSKERSRVTAALIECDREYPIGRVPLDEVPTPAQICERIRAALTTDPAA